MMITVEEGAIGGFGSQVLNYVVNAQLMRPGFILRTLMLPDLFQEHDDMQRQYDEAGLNASSIVRIIESGLIRTA
jgi:1-deoxy-D-xylulose-5-phosphate synthase